MPWCKQCKCYHYASAQHCVDVRFEQATLDAWAALYNFRLVHKALLRTLEGKS
jgi:hypothetical protein